MQKGGIQLSESYISKINEPSDNIAPKKKAFVEFLYHSTCEILSYKTAGGIIIKLTLKDEEGVESPYVLTRSNNPYLEVRELILKIVFINDNKVPYKLQVNRRPFFATTRDKYLHEVNIQIDIFEKSLDTYLEPICPGIAFSDTYYPYDTTDPENNFQKIMEYLIENSIGETQTILLSIKNDTDINKFVIGFIAMEFLTGFETLANYQNQNSMNIDITDSMARYEIARLFKLGYIHGDLHKANLLIDPNYQYFEGIPGRVILIDFGKTFQFDYINLLHHIKEDNLYKASFLSILEDDNISVDDDGVPERIFYKWIIKQNETEENETLKHLSESRERQKKLFEHLSESRERQKKLFEQHLAVCDNLESSNNVKFTGGVDTLVLPSQVSSFELPMKPETQENKHPKIEIKKMEQKNVFSILDPEKKFKKTYIKNYIATEKEYNKQILEYINLKLKSKKSKSKGGKYKTRKYNNKKKEKHKKKKK